MTIHLGLKVDLTDQSDLVDTLYASSDEYLTLVEGWSSFHFAS
jgi:hypothetical protein